MSPTRQSWVLQDDDHGYLLPRGPLSIYKTGHSDPFVQLYVTLKRIAAMICVSQSFVLCCNIDLRYTHIRKNSTTLRVHANTEDNEFNGGMWMYHAGV